MIDHDDIADAINRLPKFNPSTSPGFPRIKGGDSIHESHIEAMGIPGDLLGQPCVNPDGRESGEKLLIEPTSGPVPKIYGGLNTEVSRIINASNSASNALNALNSASTSVKDAADALSVSIEVTPTLSADDNGDSLESMAASFADKVIEDQEAKREIEKKRKNDKNWGSW